MATVNSYGAGSVANLSTSQTGSAVSTNIVARRPDGNMLRPSLLRIVTTIGGTPTCTYLVEGSPDGTSWFPLPTQDLTASGPPGTLTSATFTITTATTTWKLIPVDTPWTFVRLTYSANTNVTNTADVFAY
jgi:hypothetical protein